MHVCVVGVCVCVVCVCVVSVCVLCVHVRCWCVCVCVCCVCACVVCVCLCVCCWCAYVWCVSCVCVCACAHVDMLDKAKYTLDFYRTLHINHKTAHVKERHFTYASFKVGNNAPVPVDPAVADLFSFFDGFLEGTDPVGWLVCLQDVGPSMGQLHQKGFSVHWPSLGGEKEERERRGRGSNVAFTYVAWTRYK